MDEKVVVTVPQPQEVKPETDKLRPPRILTQAERNDLRNLVLKGGTLTLEEARDVYHTIRQNSGAAVITGESTKKTRKKKEALSDAQLDAELKQFGL